jgi:asparagine synthase (glutamine-hydrolysing)
MCGIAGSLGRRQTADASLDDVGRMVATLVHRGPDDGGVWSDRDGLCALGARRLAILDVGPSGRQPMASPSTRFVVVLNGEIYNHLALRRRLEAEHRAPAWRGHSDTETMAAAFDAWGIEATVAAANGMFAFAVWDRDRKALTLARDRLGEKPLHYGRFGGTWLFGSEIKALVAHPNFRPTIDRQALGAYMAQSYVSAPQSIYQGVVKLAPGSLVTLTAAGDEAREIAYWSAAEVALRPRLQFARPDDAIDALESLLTDAVRRQMLADRPLGALLSGGIDSTSVVALMCAHRTSTIQTFSIGFLESAFNEAHHAARVAQHLGTAHTELYVDANDVRETIPLLARIYDEPFADVSQIPTFLVSRLAGRSVTVALTGDGGDELFGGYPRYAMGARLWPLVRRVPRRLRPSLARLMNSAPTTVDRLFRLAFPHDESSGIRGLRPAQKLAKLGNVFGSPDVESLHRRLLAPWADARLLDAPSSPQRSTDPDVRLATVEEEFMLRDIDGYLPDDILTKIDRASMAVSLESRAPLLDQGVVEFALRLPYEYKFRDGVSKWILRQALYRHVPQHLVDRPKMGFEMPIASWLRGPLKAWAYDLLGSSRSDAANLLDLRAVRRLLDYHASGVGDGHQPLWTALMYLNWAQAAEEVNAAAQAPRDSGFEVAESIPGAPVSASA